MPGFGDSTKITVNGQLSEPNNLYRFIYNKESINRSSGSNQFPDTVYTIRGTKI
jgi:hypothetical protein